MVSGIDASWIGRAAFSGDLAGGESRSMHAEDRQNLEALATEPLKRRDGLAGQVPISAPESATPHLVDIAIGVCLFPNDPDTGGPCGVGHGAPRTLRSSARSYLAETAPVYYRATPSTISMLATNQECQGRRPFGVGGRQHWVAPLAL